MLEPLTVLQKVFGYRDFRGTQAAVIERVLAGKHTLVVMPTGGGKSVCYQVPAVALSGATEQTLNGEQTTATSLDAPNASSETQKPTSRSLTIVLSPLIALMKDQVDTLIARGVAAVFINSSLTAEERNSRYAQLASGQFDLLYVTPERFRKPDFLEVLKLRTIALLAVDEAHCVSQWAHDFRPDYTRLREIRRRLGDPPTLALTATATPAVQSDIIYQLGLSETEMVCFHEGIERPNLALNVPEVWGEDARHAGSLSSFRRKLASSTDRARISVAR